MLAKNLLARLKYKHLFRGDPVKDEIGLDGLPKQQSA